MVNNAEYKRMNQESIGNQEGRRRDFGYHANQSCLYDRNHDFNQKEKQQIFDYAYSCIDRFYQLIKEKNASKQ
jgi:hypothetical protein